MIYQNRGKGCFAGFAFATDESPPSQPRFRGLRFQITAMMLAVAQGTEEERMKEAMESMYSLRTLALAM